LAPVPAITGIRPAAWSTVTRISSQCSSTFTVGDSPVVPTITMASVPSWTWKSTSRRRPGKSRLPSSCIGVTMATIDPLIMVMGGRPGLDRKVSVVKIQALNSN